MKKKQHMRRLPSRIPINCLVDLPLALLVSLGANSKPPDLTVWVLHFCSFLYYFQLSNITGLPLDQFKRARYPPPKLSKANALAPHHVRPPRSHLRRGRRRGSRRGGRGRRAASPRPPHRPGGLLPQRQRRPGSPRGRRAEDPTDEAPPAAQILPAVPPPPPRATPTPTSTGTTSSAAGGGSSTPIPATTTSARCASTARRSGTTATTPPSAGSPLKSTG